MHLVLLSMSSPLLMNGNLMTTIIVNDEKWIINIWKWPKMWSIFYAIKFDDRAIFRWKKKWIYNIMHLFSDHFTSFLHIQFSRIARNYFCSIYWANTWLTSCLIHSSTFFLLHSNHLYFQMLFFDEEFYCFEFYILFSRSHGIFLIPVLHAGSNFCREKKSMLFFFQKFDVF